MSTPTKLTLVAYTKGDMKKDSESGRYSVQVNPEKYSQTFKITYETEGAAGSLNTPLKFSRIPPATLKFELIFDATGVLDPSPDNLVDEITRFEKLAYAYDGKVHQPHYLMLFWGSLAFSARLTDYSLTYTLFKPDGTPLRAKADVTFAHYQSPELISQLEDRQSPDITHHIVVKAGDTLPVLCERVYGDNRHYIDVARHNRLVDFRHLMPGRKLVFPPLD